MNLNSKVLIANSKALNVSAQRTFHSTGNIDWHGVCLCVVRVDLAVLVSIDRCVIFSLYSVVNIRCVRFPKVGPGVIWVATLELSFWIAVSFLYVLKSVLTQNGIVRSEVGKQA